MTYFCDAMNMMLYILLELATNQILLRLTRWAKQAIRHLEDYLGIVNWTDTQSKLGIHTIYVGEYRRLQTGYKLGNADYR